NDKTLIKKLVFKYLSNQVLVHNDFSKKELIRYIPESKILVIKHGGFINYINNNLHRDNVLRELKLSNDFHYILFFGQIKEVKGLDLLINAFALLKKDNYKLIIAGKVWKDNFDKYEELIKE